MADVIAEAKLRRSSLTDGASACPSSSEPPLLGETQRIGTLVMPRLAWSAAWTHGANSVRMQLGGEQIEVKANGKWEPPMPASKGGGHLPQPRPRESHQSYFLRVLGLFKGEAHSREQCRWFATRKWAGQRSDALRDAIAAGEDLPVHQWSFVTEKPTL